jgi:hypothetical protein
MRAVASFTIDTFEPEPPFLEQDGVAHGRIRLEKTFQGEIEGHGSVVMLATQNPGGAGYVALERISGVVGGRQGGFSLLHLGLQSGAQTSGQWPVVPGSGTGELTGVSGQGQIEIDAEGRHTFTLEYELS